jgi:acetyl/propionyl-CoA carboxylase alpha subunit
MNKLTVTIDDKTFEVEVQPQRGKPGEYEVTLDGQTLGVYVPDHDTPEAVDWMIVDNRPYELIFGPDLRSLQLEGLRHTIQVRDQEVRSVRPVSGDGRIKAPIPGLIARINVEPDQVVEAGQTVLVLEAMKMENEIRAPRPGVVRQIHVKPGQTVILHEALVEIE